MNIIVFTVPLFSVHRHYLQELALFSLFVNGHFSSDIISFYLCQIVKEKVP
jgi:hypothetical protein